MPAFSRVAVTFSAIAVALTGAFSGGAAAAAAGDPVLPAPGDVVADAAVGGPTDALEPFVEEALVAEPVGDVSYDLWNWRWGQSLGDVPFGALPDSTTGLTGGLEAPANVGDQYAMRMRTLLTPTESGKYRFSVAGDDDVRLFLNPAGDDPRGAGQVAYVAGWTTLHQFDRFASQTSDWYKLKAGVSYYVEVIGKEGSGDDHFEVAWELNKGFARQIIPADFLEATRLGEGGWRVATPVGLPGMPGVVSAASLATVRGPETLSVSWLPATDAKWYEVRLEGGGQARELTVTDPSVTFDNLVPDTRYLLEVAPANPAARLPASSAVVLTTSGPYPTPVTPVATSRPAVTYDRWDTGWWTLTSVPAGREPASTSTLSYGLETPPMLGENHAARLRAVLQPTVTGDYTFFLSADDDARLSFNADGVNADGAVPIATVAGWTGQYQWDRFDSQSSATYRLQKDHAYYIEAIAVHGLGLDHLEVGWSRDGGPIEVVPNAVLSPTMAGAGGWRQDAGALPVVAGAPKHLEASVTSTSVTLSWTAPEVSKKKGDVDFYEVVIASDAGTVVEIVTGTKFSLEGLTPDTKYEAEVFAWNASGSGKSDSKKFTTAKPVLPVPGDVKDLKAAVTSTSVTLSWSAPKVGDKDGPVEYYELLFVAGGSSRREKVQGAASVTFDGLKPDTSYEVEVAAWNASGAGKSDSEKFTTAKPVLPVPGDVKDLKETVTSSSVTLAWSAPKVSDKDGPVEFYEVVVTSDAGVHVEKVTGTTVSFGRLTPDTSYEAEVVAINDSGSGKAVTKKFKTDKLDEKSKGVVAATVDNGVSYAPVSAAAAKRFAGSTVNLDELMRRIESVRAQVDLFIQTANSLWN